MEKIHFIGIGGIGMSALARYYHSQGFLVSGSDGNSGEVTEGLQKEGIHVVIGASAENIPHDVSKVVYTIAIQPDNVELVKAKEVCNKVLTYPEALGEMTNEKKVIAVCGTHGKTTTTAMTYFALKEAGVDVSMIVGSLIDHNGKRTNYIPSNDPKSPWIVIEACEYRRSFLNYNPDIILVTNIDNDHLDYFKDVDDIKNAFQEFVNRLKPEGKLIVHSAESFLVSQTKFITEDIHVDLSVPGIHNRKNASLVVTLGEVLGLDSEKILIGLKNFKGTWRRQEYKGKYLGMEFYDDYAHHPTEIKATLQAFREKFPDKKIIAVFQPHLFSRTKMLFNDFVQSFGDADKVIVMPIYVAREKYDDTISSNMLSEAIEKDSIALEVSEVVPYLKDLEGYDVVITMGAGNIYDVYKDLIK